MKKVLGISLLGAAFLMSGLQLARAEDAPAGGDAPKADAKPAKAKKGKKAKKTTEEKKDDAAAPAPDAPK